MAVVVLSCVLVLVVVLVVVWLTTTRWVIWVVAPSSAAVLVAELSLVVDEALVAEVASVVELASVVDVALSFAVPAPGSLEPWALEAVGGWPTLASLTTGSRASAPVTLNSVKTSTAKAASRQRFLARRILPRGIRDPFTAR